MKHQPTMAVLYEHGAVGPAEIVAGLAELGSLMFVLPPVQTSHLHQVRPLLGEIGEVVIRSGDPVRDSDRLRTFAPDAVLTFSESQVLPTASLAGQLGLPSHDVATARLLTDKHLQRLRMREAGVEKLRCGAMRSFDDWPAALKRVGLPAVIKPVRGEGSRNTFVISRVEEAEQLLPEAFATEEPTHDGGPVLVVEELLRGRPAGVFGDYVSVESLCDGNGVSHLAVTGKFPLVHPFRECGHFWPAPLTALEEREVIDLAGKALSALGVTMGLTHTEIKLTPEGPRIIEINGRIGGRVNHLARTACGVDLVRITGLLALGEQVRPSALRPETVHFVTWGLAPTEPCEVVGMRGADEVRHLPGITGYRPYLHVGDHHNGGVNTRAIDLLWGHCANHAELSAVLSRSLPKLLYDFAFASGIRTLSAADLRR